MLVVVSSCALLAVGWLTADGVPASEPGGLDESLLTITETAPVPTTPGGTNTGGSWHPADDNPAPPPSAETEASPTTPTQTEAEAPAEPPVADDVVCDKQAQFTPEPTPGEDQAARRKAEREAKKRAKEQAAACAEQDAQAKARKHRHHRKSTDLRNSDGSPAPSNPGFVDALPGPSSSAGVPNFIIRKFRVPPFLLPIYQAAGIEYGVRWEVLAAINEIETDYGRNLNVSSAGAVGWMQFIPSTWRRYGVDANRDGRKDPYNPVDAIFASARYLAAAGYESDVRRAVFAYNHADWYVDSVLLRARLIAGVPADLVGSLTGLTEGRFPVYARARYADDQAEGADAAAGIGIFSRPGAPVVAVNDGVIKKVGESARMGKYLVLEDAYGNSFTYAHLGSVSSFFPVPKADDPRVVPAVKAGAHSDDPAPSAPASAGSQPDPKAQSEDKTSASAPDDTPHASLPVKERLFAHPGLPAARESGGLEQVMDSKLHKKDGFETFDAYFSRPFGLNPTEVRLKRLREGARVIGGTVIGRIGQTGDGGAAHLVFSIRPAGKGAPKIDPKPILDGWKLLEATAIYRASGRNALDGRGGSLSIGQVLLMSKPVLERRVLSDQRVEVYPGGREDIRSGQIDRRVLATLEYLAESGLKPTVTSLKSGHGYLTASGNVSEHSSGNAVDIAKVNGIPIIGHQDPGGIAETTVRRLMRLQGTMQPHQIISLLELGGPTMAMADHNDHIHVGFPASTTLVFKPGQWSNLLDRLRHIENPVVPVKPSEFSLPAKRSGD